MIGQKAYIADHIVRIRYVTSAADAAFPSMADSNGLSIALTARDCTTYSPLTALPATTAKAPPSTALLSNRYVIPGAGRRWPHT